MGCIHTGYQLDNVLIYKTTLITFPTLPLVTVQCPLSHA